MIDENDLERDVVKLAAREAAAVAMETPLREPILDAVERTTDREVPTEASIEMDGSGRSSRWRGAIIAGVAIAAIYIVARWFTGDVET